jgi:hypothetical protein
VAKTTSIVRSGNQSSFSRRSVRSKIPTLPHSNIDSQG